MAPRAVRLAMRLSCLLAVLLVRFDLEVNAVLPQRMTRSAAAAYEREHGIQPAAAMSAEEKAIQDFEDDFHREFDGDQLPVRPPPDARCA